MRDPIVTINPSVRQPDECEHVKLSQVLSHFKNKDKHNIQDLREEEDRDKQNEMKLSLPVVIFGGKFSSRKNSDLEQASGLVVLDFDCKSQAESEKVETILSNDKYIYAYFSSTRGLGWKALIQIPKVENDEEYKKYWYAIDDRYPDVDAACKDICRACFYSHDPNLVVNHDAEVFTETREANLQKASQKVSRSTNYSLLNRAANLIRNAEIGERHNTILRASRLAGGWVAAGRVDYQEAQRILENEAMKKDPDDFETNKRAVSDGLDHGMQQPLPKQEEQQILSKERIKEKFDKIYWSLEDTKDEIISKFELGIEEGYKTGYKEVDELYNMHLGYTSYIYGPSFSGKSQIWFDFLKNFSMRYNMKHVVFSPETGSATDVFIKIIEMAAGADFYDQYDNKMSQGRLEKAMQFVNEHFIIIDPGMKAMDLDDIIASCEMIERVYDMKIHTLTIDPWNDLNHDMSDYNYRDDRYLEDALRKLRVVSHVNNWHITVITHAKDQAVQVKDGVRYYPPATFREVAGGQTWSRRGFMMSSVWRPPKGLDELDGIELEGNETFWIQQKYKPEWAGSKGRAMLRYDPKKHCYYTGVGKLRTYAKLDKDGQKEVEQTYVETEAPF